MRTFQYHAPDTIDEAIRLLQAGSARPLAGGTDIVVQMKERATRFPYPETIVSLDRVPKFREIEMFDDHVSIGAGATMTDIANHPAIRERYPALAEGAGVVGSLQTMNMATVGGNVCNAAPSADTAPALLAYDAVALIAGPSGINECSLDKFFVGPGVTVLNPGQLLVGITMETPPPNTGAVYVRNTPRKQMDIAVVGVAVALTLSGDTITRARVALGAVAPTPVRAAKAEAALEGQPATDETFARAAEDASTQDCTPITDIRASAEFRRHLVKVITGRLLAEAAQRARGNV